MIRSFRISESNMNIYRVSYLFHTTLPSMCSTSRSISPVFTNEFYLDLEWMVYDVGGGGGYAATPSSELSSASAASFETV